LKRVAKGAAVLSCGSRASLVTRKIIVLLFLLTAACDSRASEDEWRWKLMNRCWKEGGSFHYWEEEEGKQIVFECHTHNPANLMFRDVYKK